MEIKLNFKIAAAFQKQNGTTSQEFGKYYQ